MFIRFLLVSTILILNIHAMEETNALSTTYRPLEQRSTKAQATRLRAIEKGLVPMSQLKIIRKKEELAAAHITKAVYEESERELEQEIARIRALQSQNN